MRENSIAHALFGGIIIGSLIAPIAFYFFQDWYKTRGLVGKAERARQEKWDNYYVEFLTYGYGEREADDKADEKMRVDALNAEQA